MGIIWFSNFFFFVGWWCMIKGFYFCITMTTSTKNLFSVTIPWDKLVTCRVVLYRNALFYLLQKEETFSCTCSLVFLIHKLQWLKVCFTQNLRTGIIKWSFFHFLRWFWSCCCDGVCGNSEMVKYSATLSASVFSRYNRMNVWILVFSLCTM